MSTDTVVKCSRCGRVLKNKEHALAGIGPKCARKSMREGRTQIVTVEFRLGNWYYRIGSDSRAAARKDPDLPWEAPTREALDRLQSNAVICNIMEDVTEDTPMRKQSHE